MQNIVYKSLEKYFEVIENVKKLKFMGHWAGLWDLEQNFSNKIEKPIIIGQEKKNLIYTFTCFLAAIAKVSFMEGSLGARLCVCPNLRFF